MNIDLVNETDNKISGSAIKSWVDSELRLHKRDTDTRVEVMIVGKNKIRDLNKKYRNIDKPTDVLSFPLYDKVDKTRKVSHLGTIVMCADVARKQADESNRTLEEELEHLIKHSVKHLIGKHHKE